MAKKIFSIICKVLLGILGTWIGVLIIIEIALSPAVTSKVVRAVATEYIDGSLDFTKARISLFKRFPSLYVEIDDFCLTYPADRFDEAEKSGAQGWLLHQGCGQTSDTLASFKSFKASVRMMALLNGDIHVPYLDLDSPRIFAHSYDSTQANWNIFKLASESDEDSVENTETSNIGISLGKISLSNHPHIVYTDSQDTLFALLRFKSFDFKGRIANRKVNYNNIGLQIDSLFAAGRIGLDTLAFGMQSLKIDERGKNLDMQMKARTLMATKALGRLHIPINIDGSVSFPKDSVFAVNVERFNAEIATIPIEMTGEVRMHHDGIFVNADAAINRCNINGLLKGLAKNLVPESDKISTNSLLSLKAHCNGKYIYETGQFPQMSISVDVPQSWISHKALSENITLALNMEAEVDDYGHINAEISRTDISSHGLVLNLNGRAWDLLGTDPKFKVNGKVRASLENLMTFIPDSLGIKASGSLAAEIKGDAFLSQIDLYRFSQAKLNGEIHGRNLNIQIPAEELKAYVNSLDIQLGPEDQKSRMDSTSSRRMLAFRGNVDSLSMVYGNLKAHGKDLKITAKSSAEVLKGDQNFHHVGGIFSARSLSADDGAGSRLMLKETSNGFQVVPDKKNAKVPIITFTSRNEAIALKSGVQRAGLKDATITASATLNSIKRQPRQRKGFKRGDIKGFMGDNDFKQQDISIHLDEEIAKYFNEWNFRGSMKIDGGFIASPYFPLRNRLNGFKGKFNSDGVTIDEFSVSSGKSDISANGKLNGLRRIIGGKGGKLNLELNVQSNNINADELLRAYSAGIHFDEKKNGNRLDEVSDESYQEAVAIDSSATDEVKMATVVVPGNINATVHLNTKNITYSGLHIDSLKSTAIVKERCVQFTNTEAKSNIGNIDFNGFYASRSKKDIKAGFSIDFKDITAEKVISLMPAIDTLMPILKSFQGLLNCEIAATSQLDTNMNLMMPTINGILRITGDSLSIKSDAMLQKLAKRLLFKNKKEGRIDHMSVEGVIDNNVVEVFPFVLQMDRYTLALSGIQNLDMSFKYHVSLIKSPFLIRLGLDLYGSDFDHMKFHIGRAKYKNPNVPVFSKVIDQSKINLVSSIQNIFHKGVDAAIKENNITDNIITKMREINYIRAVDQKLEELSEDEKKKVSEEEARLETDTNIQEIEKQQ